MIIEHTHIPTSSASRKARGLSPCTIDRDLNIKVLDTHLRLVYPTAVTIYWMDATEQLDAEEYLCKLRLIISNYNRQIELVKEAALAEMRERATEPIVHIPKPHFR